MAKNDPQTVIRIVRGNDRPLLVRLALDDAGNAIVANAETCLPLDFETAANLRDALNYYLALGEDYVNGLDWEGCENV